MLGGRTKRRVCCQYEISKLSLHSMRILSVEVAFRMYRSMMFVFLPQQLKAPCVAFNDEKNKS